MKFSVKMVMTFINFNGRLFEKYAVQQNKIFTMRAYHEYFSYTNVKT
jgi:hypothetical protein